MDITTPEDESQVIITQIRDKLEDIASPQGLAYDDCIAK
jgi:hypothetical protein